MADRAYQERLLRAYESTSWTSRKRGDRTFRLSLSGTFILLALSGWGLMNVNISPETPGLIAKKIRASFVMNR